MLKLFQPAPVIDPLPKERVDKEYKKLRLQVFLGIFIGYAGYYLVRKNFSIAMPALEQMGFDKADLGWALSAVSIAYGISKFVMGTVSDHSNARVFIPLGLIASAVIMTVMGLIPWTVSSLSIMLMFCILFVNGWVQGMGWPPCGRVMVHWFSVRERGVKMSIWNIAHNVGGALMAPLAVFGITIFGVWGGAFYFPAMVAVIIAVIAYLLVRDTPQSCGLPPIELYKPEECTQAYSAEQEKELSTKEILFGHVFNNKLLWIIAFANAFIYFVRYGVFDVDIDDSPRIFKSYPPLERPEDIFKFIEGSAPCNAMATLLTGRALISLALMVPTAPVKLTFFCVPYPTTTTSFSN